MVPSTHTKVITKKKTGPKVIKYGNSSRPFSDYFRLRKGFFWISNSEKKGFPIDFYHTARGLFCFDFPRNVFKTQESLLSKKNWNACVYESRHLLYNRCLLFSLLEIQFRRRVIKKNESTIRFLILKNVYNNIHKITPCFKCKAPLV